MPPLPSLGIDGYPIRMRLVDIIVRSVWIGAANHNHIEFPATTDEIAERVALAEPLAPIVKRDARRIVGYAAAGAEAGSIGVGSPEVIEPELKIELTGIVLDERELRPTHRPIEPWLSRTCLNFVVEGKSRGCDGSRSKEVSAIH